MPTDPLKMIAFFEQCQATDKAAGILKKVAKDKQPKERKTAQLPVARSRESSYRQHCSLGCGFRFLFRFFGDRNLEQDSGSGPDSSGIRSEHTLMFQLFKRPEP